VVLGSVVCTQYLRDLAYLEYWYSMMVYKIITDFEDNMAEISPLHLEWAKLMQERLTQKENDTRNIDTVVDH